MHSQKVLPTLIDSYRTSGASDGQKAKNPQPIGFAQLEEKRASVRNTFIDTGLSRTSSFEDFFEERGVLSCPSCNIGRLTNLVQELEIGDEGVCHDDALQILTPSCGTSSCGPSPCRSNYGGDVDVSITAPWFGLRSPLDTPLDCDSFSVSGSLQDHVRMLEDHAQSQRQVPLYAQGGQLDPVLTVHQLTPAVSKALQAVPEPQVARRTVLQLDVAIEDSVGTATFAQTAAIAPCEQGNDTCAHQIHYSSGMMPQYQAPPPHYHELSAQALYEKPLPHPVVMGVQAQQSNVFCPMRGAAAEHFPPSGVYNENCTLQANRLQAPLPTASVGGDHSSFAGHPGMSVVTPNGGYGQGVPAGQHIDRHLGVSQYSPFTMPAIDESGIAVVARGHEIPMRGCSMPRSLPPPGPALGSPELPSTGSAGHSSGRCKPCAFLHNRGCENGIMCEFCHLCEPGEKKRRHKEKLASRRKEKQALVVDFDSMSGQAN